MAEPSGAFPRSARADLAPPADPPPPPLLLYHRHSNGQRRAAPRYDLPPPEAPSLPARRPLTHLLPTAAREPPAPSGPASALAGLQLPGCPAAGREGLSAQAGTTRPGMHCGSASGGERLGGGRAGGARRRRRAARLRAAVGARLLRPLRGGTWRGREAQDVEECKCCSGRSCRRAALRVAVPRVAPPGWPV